MDGEAALLVSLKSKGTPEKEKRKKKSKKDKDNKNKDGRGGSGGGSPKPKKKKHMVKKKKKKSATMKMSSSKGRSCGKSAIYGEDWMEVYRTMKDRVWQDKHKEEWRVLEERAILRSMEGSNGLKKTKVGTSAKNKSRNRYTSVLPYDDTRVKLAREVDGSDYINASYITVTDVLKIKNPTTYIAASAPLTSTVESWYQMIWETDTVTIVMLTQCIENKKEKCTKYWPDEGEEVRHGAVVVKNLKEEMNEEHSWVTRVLVVTYDGIAKEVLQFHFLAWPDHDVPKSTEALEHVIRGVDEKYEKFRRSKDSPLLVHCSAGVGRTGTFIVVRSLIQMVEESMLRSNFVPPKNGGALAFNGSHSANKDNWFGMNNNALSINTWNGGSRSYNCTSSSSSKKKSDDEEEDSLQYSEFGSIIEGNKTQNLDDNPSKNNTNKMDISPTTALAQPSANVLVSADGRQPKKKRRPPMINIKRLVQHIRDQRASMLTRPEQYEYCYKSLLSLLAKKLGIPTTDYQGVGHLLQGTTVIALRPRKLVLQPEEESEKSKSLHNV